MPLYEYQCDACGQRFELIQKFSDPPVEVCPSCGGRVRRLLSSPAIQFKGSGWYVTDYSQKGKEAKAESAGETGKPAASSSSSDTTTSSTGSTTSSTGTSSSSGSDSSSKS